MLTPDSPAGPTLSYAPLVRAALLGRCRRGDQSFGGRYDLHYDDVEDAAGTAETGNLTSTAGNQGTRCEQRSAKRKGSRPRFALVYRTYRSISAHAAAVRLNASACGQAGRAAASLAWFHRLWHMPQSRSSRLVRAAARWAKDQGQQLERVRYGRRSRGRSGGRAAGMGRVSYTQR